jgi:threonyl-tRNA synthetase
MHHFLGVRLSVEPFCVHRAPLGTHGRFSGFLIEHYAGNFPLWLAPEQVRVLTIGDDEPLVNYAKAIVAELPANMVRTEGDYGTDKINSDKSRAGSDCVASRRRNPARRRSEGAHDARRRRPRYGSGKCFRPSAWKGNLGAKPEGGSDGGDFGGD